MKLITSVKQYIGECLELDRNDDAVLFFRGESEEHPAFLPRVYNPDYNFIEYEDSIYKEALAMFPAEMAAQTTTVERLIFMQHFGFPTRLLDIARNPLVALFFACYSETNRTDFQKDGIVHIFSVPKKDIKFCDSDSVCMLANLCKCRYDFSVERDMDYLIHEINNEDKSDFNTSMDASIVDSVICLHPKMNNPRITRQDGYFFLYGVHNEKKYPAAMKPEWICEKFKIAKDCKSILRDLDKLNINETFLFPDFQHFVYALNEKHKCPHDAGNVQSKPA
jgi:hypothetical protein